MLDKTPRVLYHTKRDYKQPIVPKIDEDGNTLPIIAFVSREDSIAYGIKEMLFEKYGATAVDVSDIGCTWTITIDANAPFLTKAQLSLLTLYVMEIVVMRGHRWLLSEDGFCYGSTFTISEIRRKQHVNLFDYFVERRLVIVHPRMR